MRNLNQLTEIECIEIAKIVEPNVNWVLKQNKDEYVWNGFDLVGDVKIDGIFEHMFQIDYDENPLRNSRFRIYVNLYEFTICEEKLEEIKKYLEKINVIY